MKTDSGWLSPEGGGGITHVSGEISLFRSLCSSFFPTRGCGGGEADWAPEHGVVVPRVCGHPEGEGRDQTELRRPPPPHPRQRGPLLALRLQVAVVLGGKEGGGGRARARQLGRTLRAGGEAARGLQRRQPSVALQVVCPETCAITSLPSCLGIMSKTFLPVKPHWFL